MERWAARLMLWATLVAGIQPWSASAGPEPGHALDALVAGPARAVGDAVAGVGWVAAAGTAAAGDLLSLADAQRWTRPLLRGLGSNAAHRLALGISWTATGFLEGLRAEDIERLPEAPATYLSAAPGVGRLHILLEGLRALGLSLSDALSTPALVGLYLAGLGGPAGRLAQRQRDARTRGLGPLPAD